MCYHIWQIAPPGNAMFRIRRCFRSRSMARKVAVRGVTGDDFYRKHGYRGAKIVDPTKDFIILKCRLEDCPCRCGE